MLWFWLLRSPATEVDWGAPAPKRKLKQVRFPRVLIGLLLPWLSLLLGLLCARLAIEPKLPPAAPAPTNASPFSPWADTGGIAAPAPAAPASAEPFGAMRATPATPTPAADVSSTNRFETETAPVTPAPAAFNPFDV